MILAKRNKRIFIQLLVVLLLGSFVYFFTTQEVKPKPTRSVSLASSHTCTGETCVLRNVCLNERLEIEYFTEEQVTVKLGSLMAAKQNYWLKGSVDVPVVLYKPPEEHKLDFERPVVAHKMIAVGNFGHAILQNLLPTARMVRDTKGREELYKGYRVLLLNDCKNCGMPSDTCVDGQGSYGYSSCGFQRDYLYRMITKHDPIDAKSLFTSGRERVCLAEMIVGMDETFDMLNEPQKETFPDLKEYAREMVYQYIRIPSSIPRSNTINIVLFCKIGGRHGGGLNNCGLIPKLVSEVYRNRYKGKRVAVEMINFDMMLDMTEQFRIISRAHIYIANGGSSSYYTLFLKKGAVSMIVPQCDSCRCFDLFPQARITPNVTYMSIRPSSITCPTERCMQPEFPDCGKQSLTLLDSFKEELDQALEIAYKSSG